MDKFYLFILASRHHRHLSIGVTADLVPGINRFRRRVNLRLCRKRVFQKLVYVETIAGLEEAIAREIQLKRTSSQALRRMVESVNPGWDSISLRQLASTGY